MIGFRDHRPTDLIPSRQWIRYFERNKETLFEIPWAAGVHLSPAEKNSISHSIQIFQLGESSDGYWFERAASKYAGETGDSDYLAAQKLFMAEEHRHAKGLGRLMDLAGIPRITHTWSDTVFRCLRHGRDLETAICVLITAEFIARVYYDALRLATRSLILRTLCDQILQDERAHIKFQAQRIAILRQNQSWFARRTKNLLHRTFFFATSLVVWMDHRPVFKQANLTFGFYVKRCMTVFNQATKEMEPRAVLPQEFLELSRASAFPSE